MAIEKDLILDHLGNRESDGEGRLMQEAAYYLMRLIFRERDFDSIEQLLEFCEDPDNLRPWLRNETDRIVLGLELGKGLREMKASRHLRTQVAERGSARRPDRRSGQVGHSCRLQEEASPRASTGEGPELRVHCVSDCGT